MAAAATARSHCRRSSRRAAAALRAARSGPDRPVRACSRPAADGSRGNRSAHRQRARAAPSSVVHNTAEASAPAGSRSCSAAWAAAGSGRRSPNRCGTPAPSRPMACARAAGRRAGAASRRASSAWTSTVPAVGAVRSSTEPVSTCERPDSRCGAPGGRRQPVAGLVSGARSRLGSRPDNARATASTSRAGDPSARATQTCRPPPGPDAQTTCRSKPARHSRSRSSARSSLTGPYAGSRSKPSSR